MTQRVEKWKRWLLVIKDQLYTLMWSRHVFNETFEIIRANEGLPRTNSFYLALRFWYGDHVMIGLRRQLKSSDQSISLVRLIEEIGRQPELLSRKRWRQLHEGYNLGEDWPDRGFDQFAPGRDSIDPAVIAEDLAKLAALSRKCEAYIDKRVAHHDRGGDPPAPTYDEVNAALDAVDRLFKKYYLLVTADNIETLPTIAYNWKKVFKQAWIPPAT